MKLLISLLAILAVFSMAVDAQTAADAAKPAHPGGHGGKDRSLHHRNGGEGKGQGRKFGGGRHRGDHTQPAAEQ